MSSAPEPGARTDIVIGVGHAERRDDGVGPYVAQGLRQRGVQAIAHEGDGTGLLDLWEGRQACVVVDAMTGAAAPGTVHVFNDFDGPAFRRAAFVHSTHRLGVPEAVSLGRSLGRLPRRLTVIGITGADFGFGGRLSGPVAAAADRLIERLAEAPDAFDEGLLAGLGDI